MSSFGSLLSVFAVIIFVFMLWEAFLSERSVLFSVAPSLSREWEYCLPPDFHSNTETSVCPV